MFDCSLPLAAMFAWLPPSSSDLVERKSVVPPSPPADRRREHRGRGSRLVAAYFVVSRRRKACRLTPLYIARCARGGWRLSAAAFLIRSQTKSMSARSLVQDSSAPAWLSTAACDPVFDCLRSAPARIARAARLLRHRSPTKGASAHSSSVWRRAIRSRFSMGIGGTRSAGSKPKIRPKK